MFLSRPEIIFNPLTATLYDFFAWPFVFVASKLITAELAETKGKVLEVGSGTGLLTEALASLDATIVGIEPSPSMLEKAKTRLAGQRNVTFLPNHAEGLPTTESFDAVVFSYVFRHLKPESLNAITEEIVRVTQPNSKLLIADFHLPLTGTFPKGIGRDNPSYLILGVLAAYDPASLARFFENYGFQFVKVSYFPLSFLLVMQRA